MRGNLGDSKVVDGKHGTFKGGDVGDNCGMIGVTCGAEVSGGLEVLGANGVDDVDGGNIVSCVEHVMPPTWHPVSSKGAFIFFF